MEFACTKCCKRFKHGSAKYRHQSKCTYESDSEEETNPFDIIKQMQERLDALEQQQTTVPSSPPIPPITTTITGDHNTVTNNVNIILPYGKENVDYLTSAAFLNKCLRRTDKGVLEFIASKHFHVHHPENHNVAVTNLKTPYVQTYTGKTWEYHHKDKILEDMVHDTCDRLDVHYDSIKHNITSVMANHRSFVRSIEEFIKTLDTEEKREKLYKHLMRETYAMLFNKTRAMRAAGA